MELLHNRCVLGEEAQRRLSVMRIGVAGAGGLGGFCIEGLVRLGARRLLIADCDSFESSNLNRQLYCDAYNIGNPKAGAAAARVKQIAPDVHVDTEFSRIDEKNAKAIFSGCGVIFDCLDSSADKLMLQKAALGMKVPLIHGAADREYGQAAIVIDEPLVEALYANGANDDSQNAVMTPMLVAALQLEMFVQYLRGECPHSRMAAVDMRGLEVSAI